MTNAIAAAAPVAPPALRAIPLRVALFTGNYNYVVDGPVRALNRLIAHLEARDHAALVFAPTTATPALQHSGELFSIPSIPLPGKRSEFRLGLGLNASARARLDSFAPTIVHLATPDWLGLSALNYARDHGLPAVASFHTRFDTYPRYYGMAWLEKHVTDYMRYFYGRCARVYAPSQSMIDELRRDRIGREVRLWARGVDHALFNPDRRDLSWRRNLGVSDDATLVAWVGRIVLEKGIHVFAEALRRAALADRGIRPLVVGDGPEKGRFAELLPEAVFTGYLEGQALARAYASADIFFNPSITETFGNVTLEAMASGIPSVCASASGSRSLIADGETGVLVDDPEDAEAFAAALVRLAAAPVLRRRMGAAARAKSASFEWDSILDHLVLDYQEIVSRGADRR